MNKAQNNSLFFYQGDRLVTVKQGAVSRIILRTPDMPLAEQQTAGSTSAGLLAIDDKGSVLSVQEADEDEPRRYSAYGHEPGLPSSRRLLGFNGEHFERASGCYPLGSGYRSYSPGLMRFQSPDDWSPFGQGGLNPYAFCAGDPVNNQDPSGHMPSSALRVPPSTPTITALREPDIFANIIKHSRLADAAALSRASKHLKQMTQPAMTKIKRSREQPELLLASAQEGTVGPALGHSYEVLVKSPSIDLTPFKGKSPVRDQLIRNIEADRQFRAAQRDRSPSFDSVSSASDSEDEIARINEGIRRALRGPQLEPW
ncbi:RHS repeat-associated core domain-containing protein [Pseudomonas entomophila]|uniref:RHS repeat-associated core domain-containing protein n=1 Tax=Pseudomonas entomophila TaxID=312306 RepID=UPI001C614832|nr:RHS repeat-associated core domain-containing protein [Pseudomonas entomophila]